MMDSAMDDGDLARLLRRTIDLLAQVYYECRSFYRGKQACRFSIYLMFDMDLQYPPLFFSGTKF